MRRGARDEDDLEVLPVEDVSPFARPAEGRPGRPDAGGGSVFAPAVSADVPIEFVQPSLRYRVALVAVLALFVSAVGSLLVVPGETTATRAWAMVRDFVESHDTARFTVATMSEFSSDEVGGGRPDSTPTMSSGEVRLPGDVHALVKDDDGSIEEYVAVGGVLYSRHAESAGLLDDETWDAYSLPSVSGGGPGGGPGGGSGGGGDAESSRLSQRTLAALATAYAMRADFGLPYDVRALFALARPGELAESNRLRGSAVWDSLLPGAMRTLLSRLPHKPDGIVNVEAEFGPRGRLDGLSVETLLTFEGATHSQRHDIRFTAWDDPVDIKRPAKDVVDETPLLDEDQLESVSMPVYAPTRLPAGWELVDVAVTHRDDDEEECETATIEYVRVSGVDDEPVEAYEAGGDGESAGGGEASGGAGGAGGGGGGGGGAGGAGGGGGAGGAGASGAGGGGREGGAGGAGASGGSAAVVSEDDSSGGDDFEGEGGDEGEDDISDMEDPPSLSVTSVAPDCPWLSDYIPSFDGARTVRIDAWDVLIVDDVQDNSYSYLVDGITASLELGRTRILASTNVGEAFLMEVLPTLAPIDLAAQPISGRVPDAGD